MSLKQTKSQPVQKTDSQFITGQGSYNRESGNKTLIFVGILIIIIVILVIATMFMIHRRSSVLIQGETMQIEQTVK